ncbi:Crp/Fnr family transcriptional regulator [Rhodoferax sp. PAMC 29310]|uniref:Crp/Fnr family transcriptional regulator n=1 Tax=Rhodoferax sp. PAMC 29310 TaxID=2822760 RepID=UPI001B320CF8|nr:Crp/Fnr family transcriptional regulator [Rhodoferax sp. PAMC 29310]
MKVDPAIAQFQAENVRAQTIVRPAEKKMGPATVLKIREKVPLFRDMPMELLMRTLAICEQVTVEAGSDVFKEGDMGDSFFVLISGEVIVGKERGDKLIELARLGVGDCFGEMALVGKHVRTATVRANRDAVAMRFYRDAVDAEVESAHMIYRNMARILAMRLEEASATMADLLAQNSRS